MGGFINALSATLYMTFSNTLFFNSVAQKVFDTFYEIKINNFYSI